MEASFNALRRARLLKDDAILRCHVGPFDISAVRSTHLARNAAVRWHWDDHATTATRPQRRRWAASSNASLLVSSYLSGEERIRARMSYGAEYVALTEAMATGEIRGSLDECPSAAKHDLMTLTVDKILYGSNHAFSSSVESSLPGTLPDADARDVTLEGDTQKVWQQYLNMSEQGRSSRMLLLHRDNDPAEWSGGLMVKSMGRKGSSRVNDEDKDKEEDEDDELVKAFSDWWDESVTIETAGSTFMSQSSEVGLEGALEHFLSDSPLSSSSGSIVKMENVRAKSCDFHCRCTRDQFLRKVSMLPVPEILEILHEMRSSTEKNGTLDLTCHHCNEHHPMSCEDLESMLSS